MKLKTLNKNMAEAEKERTALANLESVAHSLVDADLIIAIGTAALIASIKNKKKKAGVKKVALKIFRTIRTSYAGDKDFE